MEQFEERDIVFESNLETKWLNGHDSIFANGNDKQMNACLNWSHDPTHAYVTGFMKLAEIGIEHVDRTRSYQDTLVYPIAYLFRHHLELLMKDIIADGYPLLSRPNHPPKVHDLLQLWFECKSIMREVWPEESTEELKHAERIVKELAGIDPEGEVFRYPKTRKGTVTLQADLKILNLISLSSAVGKLSRFLGGVNCALSEYLTQRRAMERDLRSY